MAQILKTENLTKDYGNAKGAFDINIELNSSEIVGFIGPNGAGKTTTMNLITKLTKPTQGNLVLFGNKIETQEEYNQVASNIGFLPSEGGLYDSITAKELLEYASQLYGISDFNNVINYAAELKLDLNTKIKKLSLGNKRKVGVIQALLHNPKLLILDEPTSGLDPLVQKQVLDLIRKAKENGGAVLLSSHNLAEVESVCDRIIMIKEGKIIFTGKTNQIVKKTLKRFLIENVSKDIFEKLKQQEFVKDVQYLTDDITAYAEDSKKMIDYLVKNNLYNFYIEKPTLEETFIDYY